MEVFEMQGTITNRENSVDGPCTMGWGGGGTTQRWDGVDRPTRRMGRGQREDRWAEDRNS